MKALADAKRSDVTFEAGEHAFIKLWPHKQVSVSHSPNKLSKLFYGPYFIIKKIKACAYEVGLTSFEKIHNVFHLSALKKAYGGTIPSLDLPEDVVDN